MVRFFRFIIPESLLWLVKRIYITSKYKDKKINLRYKANFSQCDFGLYNVLYPYSRVYTSSLGDFTYVGESTTVSYAKIGKFCAIGPNCKIGVGQHPSSDFVSTHPIFFSTRKQAQVTFAEKDYFSEFEKITIGNDVWIGTNAIILDGVNIGDGAIVAAGAVVRKDVPAYAVVGGVPAKVLRYRFTKDEIDFLIKVKWWDKDIDWLKKNYKTFHSIKAFLKMDDLGKGKSE